MTWRPGIKPPKSKRAREASPNTTFARMLRCILGITETVASKLVQEFGSLQTLQVHRASGKPFPKIHISSDKLLGKTRLARLRTYLSDAASGDNVES